MGESMRIDRQNEVTSRNHKRNAEPVKEASTGRVSAPLSKFPPPNPETLSELGRSFPKPMSMLKAEADSKEQDNVSGKEGDPPVPGSIDETGNWYENEKGEKVWKDENTPMVVDVDKNKTVDVWKKIGKTLSRADVNMGGALPAIEALSQNSDNWQNSWIWSVTGIDVPTISPPLLPSYSHPMMNETGFVKDRITSNQSMYVANEIINNDNFADAMIGAFISGKGPENFYFGPSSSVSKSMANTEIVLSAVQKFQELNTGGNSRMIKPLDWNHYSQSLTNAALSVLGSWNQGGARNAMTPANFIGGAAVKIVPLRPVNTNEIVVRISIVNVTSVGSGSFTQGGGKGDQSYPRPIGVNSAQPYTNISQTIEIDAIIGIPGR